jgi:long-chain fatty acid transport protein
MGGAFSAKADDPTAIFYNAAGIATQRGLHVYVGGALILGQPSLEGTSTFPLAERNAKFLAQPIGNIYVSYATRRRFAVGIGVFSNYGLKVDWSGDTPFAGRFLGTYASLQTVTINPTIAWQPVRWMALGVGLDLVPASVELQRSVPLVQDEAMLRFRGNDLGVGANVGVLFFGPVLHKRTLPLFTLGVHYRSAFNLDFDDGALTTMAPRELSGVLHDARASARLPMPDQLSSGFGIRPIDKLFIQLQFDWVRWSRLQELRLEVRDNPAQAIVLPQDWHSGYTLRLGGELTCGRYRPRLGVGYDWSPVPASTLNPLIPDANRVFVSAGLGVMDLHDFALELSAMGVIFQSRRSEIEAFPVEYSNWAFLLVAGVSYRGGIHPHRRESRDERPVPPSQPQAAPAAQPPAAEPFPEELPPREEPAP